jgi:hypothetical protein
MKDGSMKSFLGQCVLGVSLALSFMVPLASARSASGSAPAGEAPGPSLHNPCTDFFLTCVPSVAACEADGGIVFDLSCNNGRVCCSF